MMIISLKHLPFNANELLEKHSRAVLWTSITLLGITVLSNVLVTVSLVFQELFTMQPYFSIVAHFLSNNLLWLFIPAVIGFIGMMTSLKYFVESYEMTAVVPNELPKSDAVIKAIALNELAQAYEKQGKYEAALPLYQESLQIFEQELGKQHPDYATSLRNLAYLYQAQGKYEKALPLLAQVVKIFEQKLGKQHPDYAASLCNLAYLYQAQGETEKVLPLYQEALAIFIKVLGEEHPTTQFVKQNYIRLRSLGNKIIKDV